MSVQPNSPSSRVLARPFVLRNVAAMICFVLLLSVVPGTSAAANSEDDDSRLIIEAEYVNGSFSTMGGNQIHIERSAPIDGSALDPGCSSAGIQVSGNLQVGAVCAGTEKDSQRLEIRGYGHVDYDVFTHDGAAVALGWLVDEAEEALEAVYDLPSDGRLRIYGKPEIVAYVVSRLQMIMTKYVYSEPLTSQEAAALLFIRQQLAHENSAVAVAANEEYKRFAANPCEFERSVPPAPSHVPADKVVKVPASLTRHCALPRLGHFQGAPIPTAESFTAWGAYRVHADSPLARLGSDAAFAEQVRSERLAAGIGGTLASATGGGIVAGILAGKGFIPMLTVLKVVMPFALRANMLAWGTTGAKFATVSMAAGPAFIILGSLAMIAIATWQFIEASSVEATLEKRAKDSNQDGLRLEADRQARQGIQFNEDLLAFDHFIQNPPTHVSDSSRDRISALMYQWVFLDGDGVRPTPELWNVSEEAGAKDYRFTVGGQQVDILDLQLPNDRGTQRLKFRDGWLLRSINGGPWQPTTSFEYVDAAFEPEDASRIASRTWWPAAHQPGQRQGGFLRMGTPSGELISGSAAALNAVLADGSGGTIRLIPPQPVSAKIAPTAMGAFFPGRLVMFAANPVDARGAYLPEHFDDPQAYRYEWQVFEVGSTEPLVQLEGYRQQFTPESPGRYIAEVTMTRLDGAIEPLVGIVEFTVRSFQVEVDTLVLHDNGYDELQLELEASAPVDEAELEVHVTWPRRQGQVEPSTSTVTLACTGDPIECYTRNTLDHPEWREALTHRLHADTDLSEPVIVTVSNPWGEPTRYELPIVGSDRFSIEPIESSADSPARLEWNGLNSAVLQVPIETGGSTAIARLIPGDVPLPASDSVGFVTDGDQVVPFLPVIGEGTHIGSLSAVRDSDSGEWTIRYNGRMSANQIGSSEQLITVQANSAEHGVVRNTFRLTVSVVPGLEDTRIPVLYDPSRDIDRFPDTNDIQPLDRVPVIKTAVLGGLADDVDGIYSGEICFTVQQMIDGQRSEEHCDVYNQLLSGPDGADEIPRIPWHRLMPDGLRGTAFLIESWLPGQSEARARYHFSLTTGSTAAPVIHDVSLDELSGRIDFDVDTSASGQPLVDVECYVNKVFVECVNDSSLTDGHLELGDLPRGEHRVEVVFYAADGNYASRELTVVRETGPEPQPTLSAPVISQHPASQTVQAGRPVSFAAEATGYPEPTVQWQVRSEGGWSDIAGETATALAIDAADHSLSGNRYRAVFRNSSGSVITDEAALIVTLPDGGTPGGGAQPDPVLPLEGDELTEHNAGRVAVDETALIGGTLGVRVPEEFAGEPISVWLYSTPVDLGWHTASDRGAVTVTVPSDAEPGVHRVAVYTSDGSLIGWASTRLMDPNDDTTEPPGVDPDPDDGDDGTGSGGGGGDDDQAGGDGGSDDVPVPTPQPGVSDDPEPGDLSATGVGQAPLGLVMIAMLTLAGCASLGVQRRMRAKSALFEH